MAVVIAAPPREFGYSTARSGKTHGRFGKLVAGQIAGKRTITLTWKGQHQAFLQALARAYAKGNLR